MGGLSTAIVNFQNDACVGMFWRLPDVAAASMTTE
jgi:hypothetical protein